MEEVKLPPMSRRDFSWPILFVVDTYGKWLPMGNKGAVDRLDEFRTVGSGSKMVANEGSEIAKLWSWREELNLQPAVYK